MTARKKEAPTQEQEVKKNNGSQGNVTTDKGEPDDRESMEAKEMADEAGTDDQDNDFDNGFYGPYKV